MERELINFTPQARRNSEHLIKRQGSRKAFAEFVGLKPPAISRMMNDGKVTIKSISKICDAFSLTEEKFLESFLFEEPDIIEAFQNTYYGYFFASEENNLIDVAKIEINEDYSVRFDIKGKDFNKKMQGEIYIDDKLVSFNLWSIDDKKKYHSFAMLTNPQVKFPDIFLGGLGIYIAPYKSDKYPCAKKIIISKARLVISNANDKDYVFIHKYLKLTTKKNILPFSLSNADKVFEYLKSKFLESRGKR